MKRDELLNLLAEEIVDKWDLPWNEFKGSPNDNLLRFCKDILYFLELKGWHGPIESIETDFYTDKNWRERYGK